ALIAQGLVGIAGGAVFWLFYREDAGDAARSQGAPARTMAELIRTLGREPGFRPVLLAGIAMSAFQFTFT
ncbi:MFS transporter, partial [Acinetobacter baumannii]|uniref:MFS transporter n=1 Tax=Acinetobacter baumannii TaxID=470 RepID=UPI0013D8A949